MFHKLILSELVVGYQITELFLKVFDFLAFSTGAVYLHLIVVFLRENFIHAHVEYAQWFYDCVRRLKDAVVRKDVGEDECYKNSKKLLPSIVGKRIYDNFFLFRNDAQIKGVGFCFFKISCSAFETFVRQLEKDWRDIQTLRLTRFKSECDFFGLSEGTQDLIIRVDKL